MRRIGRILAVVYAALMLSCASGPTPTDACPETRMMKTCAGRWVCNYDKRGCEECVCSPFYMQKTPVQEALTPIEVQ
jgi:hypothetical protein